MAAVKEEESVISQLANNEEEWRIGVMREALKGGCSTEMAAAGGVNRQPESLCYKETGEGGNLAMKMAKAAGRRKRQRKASNLKNHQHQ